MVDIPRTQIYTDFKQIRFRIESIINENDIIGFSIDSDSIGISSLSRIEIYIIDRRNLDDIRTLLITNKVKKLVFSKKATFKTIDSLFSLVPCNSYIDLYLLAREQEKVEEYHQILGDLEEERFNAPPELVLGLEAFYAISAYEELNEVIPPKEVKFDSWCLFSTLNLINIELIKNNGSRKENDLLKLLPPDIDLCRSPYSKGLFSRENIGKIILNYCVDNKVLIKTGKRIFLP